MKLLDRYNRISLITTAIVIAVTGLIYYYTISAILNHQIEKDLLVEENEILDYTRLNHQLPQVFNSTDLRISFRLADNRTINRRFVSTSFYNVKENESEAAISLITAVTVKGQKYEITIIESTVETEDLIRIIFLITLGLIVLLIFVILVINRLIIKRLWEPFYLTLKRIEIFNLANSNAFPDVKSDVEEFNKLNHAVDAMAKRVNHEYLELKSFMENAAHELMTPIAVINSKLDILVQTEQFNQRQSELLGDVYATVSKLTRLNKAMLLLTKLENKLITDSQTFEAKESIEETLLQFSELFADKNLEVITNLEPKTLHMNKPLFDVLLNNMISNAIRHNVYGGSLEVGLSGRSLIFKNTGSINPLNTGQVFRRFNKASGSEGIGLGLTLVKQICENYDYIISYQFIMPYHVFKIDF